MKMNPEIKELRSDKRKLLTIVRKQGDIIERQYQSKMRVIKKLALEFLGDRLDRLTPREQKVTEMRYGILTGVPATLEEVAMEFGVTRERIRQLVAKSIEKINCIPTKRELEISKKTLEKALKSQEKRIHRKHALEINHILNLYSKPLGEGGLDYIKAFEEMENYEHKLLLK